MLHTEKKSKNALKYLSQEQLYRALDRSKQFRGYSSFNRDDVYAELRRRSTHDVDNRYVEQPRRKPFVVELTCKYPKFQGGFDPEVYYAWEEKIDRMFMDYQFSNIEIVQGATARFYGYALLWWRELVRSRRDNREPKVNTWDELKRIMRKQFVPSRKPWQTLLEIFESQDERTNATSSSVQQDNVSNPTCLEVSSLESSSSPPPQESKCDSIPSIDSCPTIEADIIEESIHEDKSCEQQQEEPMSHIGNCSRQLGETLSIPLYFEDVQNICEGNTGCGLLQKTESKEVTIKESLVDDPTLVSEKKKEVKSEGFEKNKKKKQVRVSLSNVNLHFSSGFEFFLQDFVEPLRGAQLDYSTYDKNSFSIDIGNRSSIIGLDSRTNPFEERGDDTCMRGVKLSIMDKKLKLFNKSEKSANFGRLFGWDPGIFGS